MIKNYDDITLALAGICQSACLVQNLAHQGHCDANAMQVSLNSLIDLNPTSTLSVFGSRPGNLKLGLETLIAILNLPSNQGNSEETMRYTLNIIMLERKLNSNKSALSQLAERIQGLQRQLEHFPLESDILINAIAAIYLDTISPIGRRIQVRGVPDILRSPLIQTKVRAILLAGIRAAALWRQSGGSRLQFMLSRRRLISQAKQILTQC